IVDLAVGGNLFDMYRRRQAVDGKMTRIYDADAVRRCEPYFSVRGLGDPWTVTAANGMAPYPVGVVENRGLYRPRRLSQPGIQLRAQNAPQAAGHIQPERVSLVFQRPLNRIAGQPVVASQRGEAAVFQAAEPA